MSSYVYVYPTSREKIISSAFTVGIHALFMMFLVFGLTWQRQYHPEANSVDLWASLPSSQPSSPVPPPAVKPEPVEPPIETQPPPQPEIAKPDIALKDKIERDQRIVEEKRKEEDKKRQQEMEAQHLAQEQEKARQNLAAQQASARQTEINKYRKAISDKIRRYIFAPPNMQGNPEAEFTVRVLPGGEILAAPIKKSSGVPAYDDAVERAILKAQPLPLPSPDSPIFNEFRELNLTFRPQE
jgi:colicin import membrane protein